ncbi:hypothetical protein BJV74DRAFT_838583 [Russula compacta]|nr:hypothetical protein BJV74DRAFT_838583 [Russula compacta]
MHHTPMALTHAHVPLARASLDSSKYASVNAFLKSLKLHTRTLSALFAQHTTELAVLERLYYINNNQHRPALFWQRIVEARRYSRRLRSLDVLLLVDGLRRSFHGDTTDASSKLQKGAWTHYPSAHALKSFIARLRTCTALLDNTCVRMRAIYHILTLAMQSGAFLNLVVTLTALVARLSHLSSALRRVLSTLHAEYLHLFVKIHATEASHNLTPLQPLPPLEGEDTKTTSLSLLELNKRTVPDGDLDVSVDLGEAVPRTPAITLELKSRPASPTQLDYFSLVHDATPAFVVVGQRLAAADHAQQSSTLGPSSHRAVIVKHRTRPSPSSLHATVEETREKRRNKQMRRDEIDDIFS